ncbi:hypothetical protein [Ruminococcus champanellensis]|uniref:hypothetical protein n=1 Tax=Ruminococcus champanellensis TaxID=1161942 RepID=UPI003C6DEB75
MVIPFPLIAVVAGVFCRLARVDPAQIISTRAVEIIGAGAAKAEDQFFRDAFDQTDADRQRMVDASNVLFGQMPDEVAQAALIDGTQLFQQDDRKQLQAVLGVNVVVGEKFGFHAGFARDESNNDRGAVFVPDIVLNNHDGAIALLLRTDAPAQIGVIHIAAQICVVHSVMTSVVYLGVPAYVEVKRQNRIKVGERYNILRFVRPVQPLDHGILKKIYLSSTPRFSIGKSSSGR